MDVIIKLFNVKNFKEIVQWNGEMDNKDMIRRVKGNIIVLIGNLFIQNKTLTYRKIIP